MVRFAFKAGLRFLQQTRAFTLLKRLANGKLQFEDKEGETVALTEREVFQRWRADEWHIDESSLTAASNVFFTTTPRDLASLPEEDQEDALRKQAYLIGIKKGFDEAGERFVVTPDKLDPHVERIAKERNDPTPPASTTIWRWYRKFAATKCSTKLVTDRSRSGRPTDEVQLSLFDEAVAEVYLTAQKLPGKDVFDRLITKIKRCNEGRQDEAPITAPSRATVYRWLNKLYQRVVVAAREGKAMSERQFRSVQSGLKVKKILERVELDHTSIDLLVICKLTRLILGRPWITLAIDRCSRMVVGFYLSFHSPSATSVLYCLRQSILPKDDLLAKFPGVVGPWPARGIPVSMTFDNGPDLHANAVDSVALEMGVELHYTGAGHPELKGGIERLIGTVSRDLMHKLPGTTFANPKQRGDYDSEKEAAIDLETLTEILIRWIVDVYHKTPHRGLMGRTPLEAWQLGEAERVIELPAYPRQLDIIVGHVANRRIFHYGVDYDNLRYNSPLLQSIRHRGGTAVNVDIRAFEDSVARIAVLDPDLGEYIDIPAVDLEYATGLNRHVHRLVCAEVRRRLGDAWTSDALREAKAEIQAVVDAAIKSKKTANRKAAAVVMAADSEAVLSGPSRGVERSMSTATRDASVTPTAELLAEDDHELPVYERELHEEEVTA
jgi:putative transposase